MRQESLNELKSNLTESDIDAIVAIVGSHCQLRTKNRLRSILRSSSIGNHGIYSRLIKESGKWQYIAGQSYTDEIRTLRECMLGKIY